MTRGKPKRVLDTRAMDAPTSGRFALDAIEEAPAERPLPVSNVQERYAGLFDYPERVAPYKFTVGCDAYAAEDGFPAVLDLRVYTRVVTPVERRTAVGGRSIFATEFERLRGDLSANEVPAPGEEEQEVTATTSSGAYNSIEAENSRRIRQMEPEDVKRALEEVYERLDPRTVEFLKRRGQREETQRPTISVFKQRAQKAAVQISTPDEEKPPIVEKDANHDLATSTTSQIVKNLEVISDDVLNTQQLSDYSRLAMDPMHMDFTSKYMRAVAPSQERNLVRLFDKLRVTKFEQDDDLVRTAQTRMNDICSLYLEEVINEQGKRERRFAADVNPIVNSVWSLVPIRRVIDAAHSRGETTSDDCEIVELCVLWALLLLRQQPTYFNLVHGVPGDVYCRLAELYLLGPEVFQSNIVERCVNALIAEYLMPKAIHGKLSLQLTKPIVGLDAFLPFYEDLLKRYLEFSMGDTRFSTLLLLAAYGNSSSADALTLNLLLWTAAVDVMRQVTIDDSQALRPLLEHAERQLEERTRLYAKEYPDQLAALLRAQQAALSAGRVTKARNPAVWQLAQRQVQCAKALGD